jgi:trk system potassium uptake protein TrkH
MVITMVGVMGACAGSTSGGLKSIRVLTAYKISLCEFRRALHPKAVFPVRINHTIITNEMSRTIFVYFAICAGLLVLGTGILAALGIPMLDAVGLSVSSFSNIGPTFGHAVGPLDSWDAIPDTGLWVCSFLMLAGRLEIFSLLLPFFPDFWKET